MEHHQRHRRGNTIILETMSRYFRMPSGLSETIYLSQVQQAWAIRTAVDYWRSLRPRCMGAIYWQLNDVWPVSSWSSLEYDGSWRILHYEARRFFDRLRLALIGPAKDARPGELLSVVAINDEPLRFEGRLTLRLRSMGGDVLVERSSDVGLAAESATALASIGDSDLPCPPEEAFAEAILEASAPDGRAETRTDASFLAEPKRCSLPDPLLEATVAEGRDGPELSLRCEKPAFYVAPEAPGGRFEDSGFHLMPGETRTLRFIPRRRARGPEVGDGGAKVRAEDLASALRVHHLRGSYE